MNEQPPLSHTPSKEPSLVLALGGGGVRALAHLPILATLDDYGIRPKAIAGISAGAILSVLYASGRSARDIMQMVEDVMFDRGWWSSQSYVSWSKMWELMDLRYGTGGLLAGYRLLERLFGPLGEDTFADLQIPAYVVATDFWTAEQVVFSEGPLFPAVKSSMAFPGVMTPEVQNGRVLVDGGMVNPVPFDWVAPHGDLVLASEVDSRDLARQGELPWIQEVGYLSSLVMFETILREKLRNQQPDLLLRPKIVDVGMFDYSRILDVYEHGKAVLPELHAFLAKHYPNRKAQTT